MNIACPSCPAKYGVPDEKVRGRKVRITCKRCGAAIIVDGTQLDGAAPSPAKIPADDPRTRTILGGLEPPADSAPGAPRAQPPAAAAAPAAAIPKPGVALPRPGSVAGGGALGLPKTQAKPSSTQPKPAPPAPEPKSVPWTVAVTDDDHRDMSTAQVVDAYAAHTIDNETYIWREGMEDWLTPFEIAEIAAALGARNLEPRTNDASDAPTDVPKPVSTGGWREPGRWDPAQKENAPTFEDVTVAMAAPRAQELLEAFATAESEARANAAASAKAVEPSTVETPPVAVATPEAQEPPPAPEEPPPAPEAEAEAPPEPVAKEPAAAAAPAPEPKGFPSPVRAATAGREKPRDLFAKKAEDEPPPRARMPSIPPEPPKDQSSLTGARNESSVLFSLDQLTGAGPKKAKAKKEPKVEKVDADSFLFGGSGGSGDDAPPSVANLGGGALFAAPTMAAPDFTAAVVPSAPSNPAPAAPTPSTAPLPQTAKKSGMGVWIAAGVVALAAGGGAALVLLKPSPAASPPATTAAAGDVAPPVAAPAPTPIVPAAVAAGSAAAAPSAAAAGAAATAPAAPAGTPSPPSPAAPAGTAATQPAATAPAAPPPAGAAAPAATAKPAPAAAPAGAAPASPAAPAAPAPAAEGPEFDKAAASTALSAAAASAQGECASQDGPHGTGKVTITFVNSGRATNALVAGDFAGSALGGCVARVFRSAKVPPFSGDSVRVTKTVHIP